MPSEFDLDLALRRLERDYDYGRTFYVHPFELALVRLHREEWLAHLGEAIQRNQWFPNTPVIADFPKGGYGVRPAALLCLADQVVYTAAVGAALSYLLPSLQWTNPPKDYANEIWKPAEAEWVSVPFRCWDRFRLRSGELLSQAAVVVVADITGFYEHIDHQTLISDLRGAGVPSETCRLLTTCLSRWALVNGRGLPQNISASHLLAKVYLTRVDQALAGRKYEHIRYVDNMRIFCPDIPSAKSALLYLSILLRDRGLSLQSGSGKTDILLPIRAREVIEGAQTIVVPLAKHYIEEIAQQVGRDPEYMSVVEAEAHVMRGQAAIPRPMLRAIYDAHFLKETARFDKTLFHFLIRRLGRAGDRFALEHAIDLLESHPDETDCVLSYVKRVDAVSVVEDRILDFFESPAAIYDYQVYQLLAWRHHCDVQPSERMLAFIRRISSQSNSPLYLRSSARACLGRFGNDADLDELLRAYGGAGSELERAELVCSLSRLEKTKRNGYLGKLKGDGFLVEAAIRAVKDGCELHSIHVEGSAPGPDGDRDIRRRPLRSVRSTTVPDEKRLIIDDRRIALVSVKQST